MDRKPTPQDTQKVTVVTGGSSKGAHPWRRRWVWILLVVGIVIGVGLYAFYFQMSTNRSVTDENTDTVVDVSAQIDDANQYPAGSYMWANLMLNAAMYASSNGACKQATDIVGQVEAAELEEGVDVAAARQDVDGNCRE